MTERDIGLEILEGIQEIKAFKAGHLELKTRTLGRELKNRSRLGARSSRTEWPSQGIVADS